MTRKTRRRNESRGSDVEARPGDEDKELRSRGTYEMNIRTSGRKSRASGATGSDAPVQETDRRVEASSSDWAVGARNDSPSDSGENDQPHSSEMPHMIGDFDDSANAMWSLHLGEAKSNDEARINSLKDDMDSVLIFAGLFSAALTSFLIDSVNNLQVDPAQQMVYYQQQNVALLAQISNQISSIVPQVIIPSTLPPPYPAFSPNPSDVRVNVYWFMSLVFSLSAALLATLVQQWVRDYMHVFQRYSNPLKSARLRQYLYEGVVGRYMPRVARSVPGLVHISLFLFFLGLGDTLLSVYTTVGVTTIIPIAICGFLYVLSMFAPVMNPQSPFRNPFSGLIWYLKQKVHPRRYLDRGGLLKAVSTNLYEGQMQLAMEECDGRKDRDVRAIRWLIHNRTEDDEMESFVMAIPGAFTSRWGIDVWRKASEVKDANLRPDHLTVGPRNDLDLSVSHHRSPPVRHTCHPLRLLQPLGRIFGIRIVNDTPHHVTATRLMSRLPRDNAPPDDPGTQDLAIYDLCHRVRHLVKTCDNYSVFTNKELWLKRARGCVETAASLVVCADINPELFGDLGRLLRPLHESTLGVHTAPGTDGLFVVRLECLSVVMVHQELGSYEGIKLHAHAAIKALSRFGKEDNGEQINDITDDEDALKNARRIDHYFDIARQFCVYELRGAFKPSEAGTTDEQAKEVLARDHEFNISILERATLELDHIAIIDREIYNTTYPIGAFASGLISGLRGARFDQLQTEPIIQPIQFCGSTDENPTFLPQFIFLHQRFRLLCSYSSGLRDIINGQENGTYKDLLESLKILWGESDKYSRWSSVHRRHLMERQLWRLQDLRDGGGFGFWVEFFFLQAGQLILLPLSPDAHSALILGTFRAITSNWRQHKYCIGTQRVILNLICDIATPDRGTLSNTTFPRYITDELLDLVENIVEGQSGPHIDEAVKELEEVIEDQDNDVQWRTALRLIRAEVVRVISRSRAPAPTL